MSFQGGQGEGTDQTASLGAIDAILIDRVAQLVEERAHPARVALDVEERAHVAFAIDVDRIRVLILAVARIQVAAGQDGVDVAEPELAID